VDQGRQRRLPSTVQTHARGRRMARRGAGGGLHDGSTGPRIHHRCGAWAKRQIFLWSPDGPMSGQCTRYWTLRQRWWWPTERLPRGSGRCPAHYL